MTAWHGDLFRALVEWAEAHVSEFTIREAAAGIGASYPTTKVYVRRALHSGWLEYPRRGVYQHSGRTGAAVYELQSRPPRAAPTGFWEVDQ